MKSKSLIPLLFVAMLVAGSGEGVAAEPKQVFTAEQTKAVEQIIVNYFKQHPGFIEAALRSELQRKDLEHQAQVRQAIVKNQELIFNDATSPISGNSNGKESLVVFMDPRCGFCHRFQKVLNSVQKQRRDLRIVYKVIPVLGAESNRASREELAANMQGKFAAFREAVYAAGAGDRAARFEIAKQVGLDMDKLKSQIKTTDIRRALKNNKFLAKKLSIDGTPAFIIGDKLVMGMVPEEEVIKLLDAASSQPIQK